MGFHSALLVVTILAAASQRSFAQDSLSTPPSTATLDQVPAANRLAPAPAPKAPAAAKTVAAPPPLKYAPHRSFGQWCRDLPHDPWLLVGFIFSIFSALGFLFIIYTVAFELVMGIPYKRQSYLLGGNPNLQNSAVY